MKVLHPDDEERRMRALGALMTATLGDEVDARTRAIFEQADMLDVYERARAGIVALGGDPNDVTLWRAAIEGMRWRSQNLDMEARMARRRMK